MISGTQLRMVTQLQKPNQKVQLERSLHKNNARALNAILSGLSE
jgi:hypothetical protein